MGDDYEITLKKDDSSDKWWYAVVHDEQLVLLGLGDSEEDAERRAKEQLTRLGEIAGVDTDQFELKTEETFRRPTEAN